MAITLVSIISIRFEICLMFKCKLSLIVLALPVCAVLCAVVAILLANQCASIFISLLEYPNTATISKQILTILFALKLVSTKIFVLLIFCGNLNSFSLREKYGRFLPTMFRVLLNSILCTPLKSLHPHLILLPSREREKADI